MKRILYILVTLLLISCGQKDLKEENTITQELTQKQIDSVLTNFRFEYNSPIYIDSTSQVLLPIVTRNENSRSSIKSSSLYSSSEGRSIYWNILFYNSETGKTNLLTEEKMNISDFNYNLKETGKILSKSILYKISTKDFNKDSKLNYLDPHNLYISNNQGIELRRISPENEHLETYSIIPESDQIIFKTRRDTNNDLKFDYDDELIWYKVDLTLSSMPEEIIDSTKRKKIETLFFNQWLKKQASK